MRTLSFALAITIALQGIAFGGIEAEAPNPGEEQRVDSDADTVDPRGPKGK